MFKYSNSSSVLSSAFSKLSLESIDDDETEPWHGLIQKLSNFHLDLLNAIFKETKYRKDEYKRWRKEEGLRKEEFVSAIDEVFGNCKYSLQATILFAQIDKEENSKITWDQFLDFIIDNGMPKLDQSLRLNFNKVFSPPHVQRDAVSKIVLLETAKYFCYAVISKYGCVGLYDGNMNFLTSYYTIMSREDIYRKDKERRRRNRWITDAIFLDDVLMLVITSSARNLTIYDASGLKHVVLWLILGVPNVIHSFAYHSNIETKSKFLFMGDDSGQILSFTFLQSKDGLLRKKHNDKLSLFYWIELPNEKQFITIKYYGKFHNDSVKKLRFYPDNNTLVSCSRDPNASVVIKHQENRRKTYIFKMIRGASCFSLSRLLKILLTGSDDGTIRIWNVAVSSKPIAILKNHQSGIVDVEILELQGLFLSYSRDGMLKLWHVKEQKCIQTIKIKFPSFGVLGMVIEWGIDSIYPGPNRKNEVLLPSNTNCQENAASNSNGVTAEQYLSPSPWERSHIYVTCCNYMAHIDMKFNECFEMEFNQPVLPPPPLQNSVLIPTTWNICSEEKILMVDTNGDAEVKENLSKHADALQFILQKDILKENDLQNDINYRVATLETKKLQMKDAVSKCAPFLALNLPEIEEVRLTTELPAPNSKRIKKLIDKTHHMLADASLRSQLFSEPSTNSRSLSSRSSIITFN